MVDLQDRGYEEHEGSFQRDLERFLEEPHGKLRPQCGRTLPAPHLQCRSSSDVVGSTSNESLGRQRRRHGNVRRVRRLQARSMIIQNTNNRVSIGSSAVIGDHDASSKRSRLDRPDSGSASQQLFQRSGGGWISSDFGNSETKAPRYLMNIFD